MRGWVDSSILSLRSPERPRKCSMWLRPRRFCSVKAGWPCFVCFKLHRRSVETLFYLLRRRHWRTAHLAFNTAVSGPFSRHLRRCASESPVAIDWNERLTARHKIIFLINFKTADLEFLESVAHVCIYIILLPHFNCFVGRGQIGKLPPTSKLDPAPSTAVREFKANGTVPNCN